MTDAEATLTPAEDNPWYLLATLYDAADWGDEERQAENRVAWNRYYASRWTAKDLEHLKGRVAEEELKPFDGQELTQIRQKFAERARQRSINMPSHDLEIDFQSCHFNDKLRLHGYVFAHATFNGAEFSEHASFSRVTFTGNAEFINAKFIQDAEFINAEFSWNTNFSSAIFSGDAYFNRATFSGPANFRGATFSNKAIFTNAEMKAPTFFEVCRFDKFPPQLHGATLHQRTNWRRVSWPRLKGLELQEVEDLTDDYSVLKLEMDKQKRHEDELMFFSKELECRQVELGIIKGFHILLYGWTCNYGQSIILPLCWLINLIILGWNLIMSAYMPEITWDKALLTSIANCLGSFGVHKELVGSLLKCASVGTQMLLMLQGITALILLFLIGLGLRNRFRMK